MYGHRYEQWPADESPAWVHRWLGVHWFWRFRGDYPAGYFRWSVTAFRITLGWVNRGGLLDGYLALRAPGGRGISWPSSRAVREYVNRPWWMPW